MKKIGLIILLLVLVITSAIKIQAVSGNNFPFTMDQGRDMIDIRQMVLSKSPRLIGPTTSINGVFLGPFWYYFLLPPFLVSGGNPQILMYWQIIWYQLSVIFLWWVIKKTNPKFAIFTAILLLFSQTSFNTGHYFWNANAMPIMTLFYFGTLFISLKKPSTLNLIILGIVSGLSLQVEAAFGILFFPFSFVYLALRNKKILLLLHLTFGFVVTLIPQVIFELRHQFIMTKVLVAELLGKGTILGEKMTVAERLLERWQSLLNQIKDLSYIPENFVYLLFVLGIIATVYLVLKSSRKNISINFGFISLFFSIFSGVFFLLFSQHLKPWYILGISVPFVLILAYVLDYLSSKNITLKYIVFGILVLNIFFALTFQIKHLTSTVFSTSNDPSQLKNLMIDVDWAYTEAKGSAFYAYNYVPSVYDYALNYLYWWYGTKTYGYQPSVVAYLPNQPEYITGGSITWTKTKLENSTNPTILIIESDKEHPLLQEAWEGNFSHLCETNEKVFPWNSKIKSLSECNSLSLNDK